MHALTLAPGQGWIEPVGKRHEIHGIERRIDALVRGFIAQGEARYRHAKHYDLAHRERKGDPARLGNDRASPSKLRRGEGA